MVTVFYKSTRDSSIRVESAAAIAKGISEEGGLFVPESIPALSMDELKSLAPMTYAQRAAYVFSKYLTDFTEAELRYCTESAYTTKAFETENIAEIAHLFEGTYMLELWHGPTCAFKDMALQILPYFLTTAVKKLHMDKKSAGGSCVQQSRNHSGFSLCSEIASGKGVEAAARKCAGVSVGTLEQRLLSVFPAEDACAWDRTGLTVGNPGVEVTGVVVALDPTIAALKEATDLGANVVLTHHPVFIEAVSNFMPETVQGAKPGAVVNYALSHGINCMNFHTALDVAPQALSILPTLLRLKPRYVLDPLAGKADKGFGMVCASEEGAISLKHLAARSVSVFGSVPRVWGNPDTLLESIVTCGGSANELVDLCLENGIDCLICGEVKYHVALEARQSGLSIIELGHDVSELPLCALLATEALAAGLPDSCIMVVDQSKNWYTPETIRQ